MRHDKLERELNLLLLLTENRNYTVEDICKRLQISRRNLYYYLEFFRLAGFRVEHSKPYYRISKDSPFFKKIDEVVHFTEDEAITMRQILDKADDNSLQVQRLKKKLERLYDLHILNSVDMKEQMAHNISALYQAMKQHSMVKIIGYSSPHSNSVSDRVVEPFLMMNGNREVRCYELSSGMNKTFKLARMQDVEVLDVTWDHEQRHKQLFTDVFMFSSEQQWEVRLRMGRLATSVLREEYPQAERYIEPDGEDNSHWLVNMPVSSFLGIGRFVMGLFEDIDVLGCDEFRDYLKNQINKLNNKQL